MTDRERARAALAALARTTITYPEYRRRVRTGIYKPAVAARTNWGRALALLQELAQPESPQPAPAPSPGPSVAAAAQNVAFAAQEPLVERAPAHWKVALSADPAYAQWATPEVVAELRRRGHPVYSWCDSESTLPAAAVALRDRLGLDGWIGQAETSAQLDVSLAAGARLLVGNPNAWTAEQRGHVTALANEGSVAVIAEVYVNEGDPWPDTYSSQGVPVAGFCLGLYPGRLGYVSVTAYQARTPAGAWPGVGLYHVAGVEDWAGLP